MSGRGRQVKPRRLLLAAAGFVIVITCGWVAVLWPHWVFVCGHGPGTPCGVFRCSVTQSDEKLVRECSQGADALVFREVRFADGSKQRAWYVGGRIKCREETETAQGVKVKTSDSNDCK